MVEDPLAEFDAEHLREHRIAQEVKFLLSDNGFLTFCRDSGAAPDVQMKPHGVGAREILEWNYTIDPEAPDQKNYKYKMVLWPRGSFKSTVFDVAYVCWEIAKEPNIRVEVTSETGKQARAFVEQAKDIIDSPWYRERFGVHRGSKWSSGKFYSALRTKQNIKEPTLQAAGVGEVQTGSHWDLVIMDDICSQENTKTPESIEGLWFWFGETMAQIDPGCRLLVIGTLHHYADIYCRIMKDPEMSALFDMSVHAWCEPLIDPSSTEETELFFPGRLTREFVKKQKAIMPPRLFACFYENKPTSGEDKIFHNSYFHTIEDHDVPAHLWGYIFTDFAFVAEEKRKGKRDRTAFWVVGLDCNRTAYVMDFYVGRWKPSDSVRICCDVWNRYYDQINLKGIVIEQVTHTEIISSLFEEIRRDTFVRPKIIPIGGRNQEIKEIRIEAMEPRFRAGNIYFRRWLREQHKKFKPLIDEMTEWPFSRHDDIPDAISDLDKIDAKTGSYYCPAPPAGWRAQTAVIRPPSMVSGRFNPDAKYPADDLHKRDQPRQGAVGGDLWQQNKDNENLWRRGPTPAGGDIFRKR